MATQTRYLLNEFDLPRFWYNVNADMPLAPAPVFNPMTLEPVTPGLSLRSVPNGSDLTRDQHGTIY